MTKETLGHQGRAKPQMKKPRKPPSVSPQRLTLSVVVPSYMRPVELRRCCEALSRQVQPADEIIIVWRAGDEVTERLVAEVAGWGGSIVAVRVEQPGQVAALNAGLRAAKGDIVAFTDDDAAPLPDWTLRIGQHFSADDRLGGLGGRDHWDGVRGKGSHAVVGRVQWFGRCIGFHHAGVGDPRRVEILKGVNMSFRRSVIEPIGFDHRLRGEGAQVANDLNLALQVKKRGWTLTYDPSVAVDHYMAVRHDDDQRTYRSALAQSNASHNSALSLLEYLPAWRVPIYLIWALAIGSSEIPGIAQAMRLQMRGTKSVGRIYRASLHGTLAGIGTWLRR
jgi:cellulose synthase/poly-beta-1,6-N-acetylglucosamine synthase-like glycosyltransferase